MSDQWEDKWPQGELVIFVNGQARVHPRNQCAGQHCPFHNPSDHSMKDWPMILRETALVERMCSHRVGHPDPDSVAWLDSVTVGGAWSAHGCDGCCPSAALLDEGVYI